MVSSTIQRKGSIMVTRPRRARGTGSIFWDEDKGRWVGQPSGRPDHKVYGLTYEEAESRLVRLTDQIKAGKPLTTTTFGALADDWLDHHHKSEDTIRHYRDALRKQIRPVFGHREIADIELDELQAFMDQRAYLSRSYLSKFKTIFKLVYRRAEQRGYVTKNLGVLIDLPAGARGSRESQALDYEDSKLLLKAAAPDRLYAWFKLFLDSGARPGELFRLRITDLDLSGRIVYLDGRKNKKPRGVVVSEQTCRVLRDHIANMERERDLAARSSQPWPESDLLFVTGIGTPLTSRNMRTTMRRVARDAGLDTLGWNVTPYTLRHTVATQMAETGRQNSMAIKRKLGHRDPRTTEKYYIHPAEVVEESVGMFDD